MVILRTSILNKHHLPSPGPFEDSKEDSHGGPSRSTFRVLTVIGLNGLGFRVGLGFRFRV